MTSNKMTFDTTTVKVVEFLKRNPEDESALQEHEREYIRETLNSLDEVSAYGFFEEEDSSALILIFKKDIPDERIDMTVKLIMKEANRGVKNKVEYFYTIDTMKCLRLRIPKIKGKRAFQLNTLGRALLSNRFEAINQSVLWSESFDFTDSSFELFFDQDFEWCAIDEFAEMITSQLNKPDYIEIKEEV